jgi:hypothetical protein
VGDVGTGKTRLTRSLLEEAVQVEPIVKVLDFAPPLKVHKGKEIGGYLLTENTPRVIHYKSSNIKTPRISAKTPGELLRLADINKEITEKMLMEFTQCPSKTLFINDVSIHLQRGYLSDLSKVLEMTDTAILNGYMGSFLRPDHGTGLSKHEWTMMKKLGMEMDEVIQQENEGKHDD